MSKPLVSELFINNGEWTSLLDMVYPVGSFYISYSSISPSSILGGTWVQVSGYFLRGANDVGTGGSDSITLGTDYIPSHTHGLNNHTHSVGAHSHGLNNHSHGMGHRHYTGFGSTTNEYSGDVSLYGIAGLFNKRVPVIPATQNSNYYTGNSINTGNVNARTSTDGNSGSTANNTAFNTGGNSNNTTATGGGKAFSNMPKYQNTYMWYRTA